MEGMGFIPAWKRGGLVPLLLAALFLGIEAALVYLVDRPAIEAAAAIQQNAPAVTSFFRAVTDIGLGQWYAWPSGLAFFALLACGKSRAAWAQGLKQRFFSTVAFFFLTTSAAGLINNAIKFAAGRARPKLYLRDGTFDLSPLTHGYDWNSFPSGHTATIFSVGVALSVLFPRGRFFFLSVSALVGISRIMVMAHYPSDVLAGAVFATLWTLASARYASARYRFFPLT